jgi:hypothetical protein
MLNFHVAMLACGHFPVNSFRVATCSTKGIEPMPQAVAKPLWIISSKITKIVHFVYLVYLV